MYILKLLVILHLLVSTQIEAERKIFAGELAKDTKATPFIVKITVYKGPRGADEVTVSGCGGSYIRPNWVLSASHCIKSHFPLNNHKPKYDVVLCMGSIEPTFHCPDPLMRLASELHPYTEAADWENNDIALMKVLKPWVIGPTIQIAKFPPPKVPKKSYKNKKCLIAGWGMIGVDTHAKNLKQGTVTVSVDDPECRVHHPSRQLCAKGGTAITCKGDSGGPLVCDGVLIGVLKSGRGKCNSTETKVSIFNMVEAYRDWIVSVAGTDAGAGAGGNSIVPNKLCLCIFSIIPLAIFN